MEKYIWINNPPIVKLEGEAIKPAVRDFQKKIDPGDDKSLGREGVGAAAKEIAELIGENLEAQTEVYAYILPFPVGLIQLERKSDCIYIDFLAANTKVANAGDILVEFALNLEPLSATLELNATAGAYGFYKNLGFLEKDPDYFKQWGDAGGINSGYSIELVLHAINSGGWEMVGGKWRRKKFVDQDSRYLSRNPKWQ